MENYCQDSRLSWAQVEDSDASPDISSDFNKKWKRELSADERQAKKLKADEAKAKHKLQHTDYKYRPRRQAKKGHQTVGTSSRFQDYC